MLPIARPTPQASRLTSAQTSAPGSGGVRTPSSSEGPADGSGSGDGAGDGYAEPVSEGEDDEEMDRAPARDEDKRVGLAAHGEQVREAIAWREKNLEKARAESPVEAKSAKGAKGKDVVERDFERESDADDDEEDDNNERTPFLRKQKAAAPDAEAVRARAMSIDPLAPSTAFDETLRDRLRRETQAQAQAQAHQAQRTSSEDTDSPVTPAYAQRAARNGDDRVLERNWRAPEGKKIAVPVRIGVCSARLLIR
jgi:hypothetical protein